MRVLVYLSLHCSRRWGSWFLLLFLLDSPEKEKLFPTVKKEKDGLLLESHISQAVEGLPQCSPRLWQSLHATVSAMIQMVPPLMGSPSVSSTAPSTSQNDSVTVSVTVSLISVVSFDSVAAPISVVSSATGGNVVPESSEAHLFPPFQFEYSNTKWRYMYFCHKTHNKHKSTTATDCSHPFARLLATEQAEPSEENPLHEVLVLRTSGNEPQNAGCVELCLLLVFYQ